MLSPGCLIDTQIVNIQRPDSGTERTLLAYFRLAEDIAEELISFRIYKNRFFIIPEDLFKLRRGILCRRSFEEIRAGLVMNHINLHKKTENIRDVLCLCSSYTHNILFLSENLYIFCLAEFQSHSVPWPGIQAEASLSITDGSCF